MKPSWFNIGLVFSYIIFSFTWPIVFCVLIVASIICRISQIQRDHNLLLEGDFVLMFDIR